MRLFGRPVTHTDWALAAAGVLGAIVYVWLLQTTHPDATARYAFDADEAEERARTFLEARGYPTANLERDEVAFERDDDFIESLQRTLGRSVARDLLADSADTWPAYLWDVDLKGSMRSPDAEEDGVDVHVLLTQSGEPFEMTFSGLPSPSPDEEAAVLQRHLDREALRFVLGKDAGPDAPDGHGLLSATDSAIAHGARFAFSSENVIRPPGDTTREARAGVAVFDSAAAVRMARFHLQQTAPGTLFRQAATPFRADSVWGPRAGRRGHVAGVRFQTEQRGQTVRTDVEVYASGGLRSLDVSFNPEADDEMSWATLIFVIAGGVMGACIGLGLLVAFFQRLSERMIDVRAGAIDAVVMGLCFGTFPLLVQGTFDYDGSRSLLAVIGMASLTFGLIFGFTALLAFPFTAATDAVSRSAFSDKMLSMSMVRRLAFGNRFVGAALLRGLALGAVLLGLTVLLAVLLPGAVYSSQASFLVSMTHNALVYTFLNAGWLSYAIVALGLLALGSFVWRKVKPTWARVLCIGLAFALSHFAIVGVAPFWYGTLVAGTVGLIIGAAFVRYDALTVFIGFFTTLVAGGLHEGWLVAGSPVQDDLMLGLGLLALLSGIGFVGVWSGETGHEAEDYTPSYIRELAEQERLHRDIEIAEEVQRSLLPRQMPRVEGLGLAALCLPAREVGGDYYDFVELPGGRLGVVVGDVSGKGIQASFYMTLAKGYFQSLAGEDRSPADVLARLNTLFRQNAPGGTFITMIYGVVDPAEGTFRFARAGHNPLVHLRAQGSDEHSEADQAARRNGEQRSGQTAHLLQPRGLALGLVGGSRFEETLEEVVLPFAPGDALVLYTDGFTEARTTRGQEYGEERIRARIERHGARPAQQLLQTLADDVHTFIESAGRHDDMTMVVVKRTAPPAMQNEQQGGAPKEASAPRSA